MKKYTFFKIIIFFSIFFAGFFNQTNKIFASNTSASQKKWTLAAQEFTFEQNNIQKSYESYSKTIPSLILEQMAQNLTRIPRGQEQLNRTLYDLKNKRLSLFLQLSKEIKSRDALFLQNYSNRQLKRKLKESDKKILELQEQINANLDSVNEETENRRLEILNDQERFRRLEKGEIIEEENTNSFANFFKDFASNKRGPELESIVLYAEDFSKLFEPSEQAKLDGIHSYEYEKSVTSANIQGLLTGTITIYGEFVCVSVNLFQFPGAKLIYSVVEVGNLNDIKSIATNIAFQITPKIADSMPVELCIKIQPEEALKNASVIIDDVVYSSGFENIVIASGVHSLIFSSKGYNSESTSYSFTGNRRFDITINMQKENPGKVELAFKNPLEGKIYANGLFYGQVSKTMPFSNININNQNILGHFVGTDGQSSDFLIRTKFLVDKNQLIVNAKPFDRSAYIDKRRIWMYRSYSMLIISLIPTFYCYGNYNAAAQAYNSDYGITYEQAVSWQTANYISSGISLAFGGFFVYELIRYLNAANTVLPAEAKVMNKKQYTKIKTLQEKSLQEKNKTQENQEINIEDNSIEENTLSADNL